jgi:hypothetical protein
MADDEGEMPRTPREPSIADLLRAVREKPTLPKYRAGKLLGWGKRGTDAAVRSGSLPIIDGPRQMVPTEWLRRQLQIKG